MSPGRCYPLPPYAWTPFPRRRYHVPPWPGHPRESNPSTGPPDCPIGLLHVAQPARMPMRGAGGSAVRSPGRLQRIECSTVPQHRHQRTSLRDATARAYGRNASLTRLDSGPKYPRFPAARSGQARWGFHPPTLLNYTLNAGRMAVSAKEGTGTHDSLKHLPRPTCPPLISIASVMPLRARG